MNKLLLNLLVEALIVAGSALSSGAPASYVVRVRCDDGNGVNSLGSGTLVAASDKLGLVVTNSHVVRDARGGIIVEFTDGHRHGGRLVAQDPTADLAAICIVTPFARAATIAANEPDVGDQLSIGGFGSTNTYRQASGVLGRGWANNSGQVVWCSVDGCGARQGDSGGPVFNSSGEYCGTLWGTDSSPSTMFVRLTAVRRFINSVPSQWRCQDGSCEQYGPSAPLVPVVRPTQPVVVRPPVNPPVVVKGCTCDEAKILAIIAKMEQRNTQLEVLIKGIAQRPPATGQPGAAGPKGDVGPVGPAGVAGKDATIDVEKIADAVEARIKGSLRVVMEPLP